MSLPKNLLTGLDSANIVPKRSRSLTKDHTPASTNTIDFSFKSPPTQQPESKKGKEPADTKSYATLTIPARKKSYPNLFNTNSIDYNSRANIHPTDRHKVIVAIAHLEGAKDDETSHAPKEWARAQVRHSPELKDNWLKFKDSLRKRYQNSERRQRKVEERQALKQGSNTVQWYKQRFELLCYETNFPPQVWGEEFYKGLCSPIKDKLACVANLDRQNYQLLVHHAVQLDENFLARQRYKSGEKQDRQRPLNKTYPTVLPFPSPAPNTAPPNSPQPPSTNNNVNNHITQEIREYRKTNILCMFDGGNHKTHLCQKLIEKCIKEGKPLPVNPSIQHDHH